MYYLIIDTCVWIELCNKHMEVRRKITDLVEQEKVKLIVPQIVIDEWHRHKESKIASPKEASIRGMIKNARGISEYLEQDKAEEFKRILDEFRSQEDAIENIVLQHVNAVEALFNHSSTVKLTIAENAKLQAVDYALAKKAPFQNKNSMADALILFSFINYIAEESLTNCIFVSSNTEDFSSSSNKSEIHSDLKELFDEHGIKYFSNIGLAINEIEDGLISDEYISEVEETLQLGELQRLIREGMKVDPAIFEAMREMVKLDTSTFEAIREIMKPDPAIFEAIREATKPDPAIFEAIREAMKPSPAILEAIREITKLNEVTMQIAQKVDDDEESSNGEE